MATYSSEVCERDQSCVLSCRTVENCPMALSKVKWRSKYARADLPIRVVSAGRRNKSLIEQANAVAFPGSTTTPAPDWETIRAIAESVGAAQITGRPAAK